MKSHRAKLISLALGIAISVYGVSTLNDDVGNSSTRGVAVAAVQQVEPASAESAVAVNDLSDSNDLANTFGLSVGGGALLGAAARSKAKNPVKRKQATH